MSLESIETLAVNINLEFLLVDADPNFVTICKSLLCSISFAEGGKALILSDTKGANEIRPASDVDESWQKILVIPIRKKQTVKNIFMYFILPNYYFPPKINCALPSPSVMGFDCI